ncbi:MAG: hypothetical protein LQ342_004055 [Letrouitia transgressa]|nr:MAG: hypothetical protein LQ342_004055 [Letrouitia transgressa]
MSVLVIGAGELGRAVIHALSKRVSHDPPRPSITVMLRPTSTNNPSKSKDRELNELDHLGVVTISGDIEAYSVDALAQIFRSFDTIISCTGFSAGPGSQLKLAHAVLAAGTRRYFPWQFGIDYDIIGPDAAGGIFREQCKVRELLRAQKRTRWTIVSTGMFTSFLLEPSFGVVDVMSGENGKAPRAIVRALGSWDNAVTVTQPEDIGTVVAELVTNEASLPQGGVVFTAGGTISYEWLARLLEKILVYNVTREEWTVPQLVMALAREPGNQIAKYRLVFSMGRGVTWDRSITINQQLNIPTADPEQWLTDTLTQKIQGLV